LIDDVVETNSFAFQIVIESEEDDWRIETSYKFVFLEIVVSLTSFLFVFRGAD
jgi:hypothetical protein